jgi:hypothetical protein
MNKTLIYLAFSFLSGVALAQTGIPYSNSFETIDVGSSILSNANNEGWYGAPEAVAFVTNLDYAANRHTPIDEYPMFGMDPSAASHSKVLKFDVSNGVISNQFADNLLTEVWLDTMIQPVRLEDFPTNSPVSDSQLSLAFDTNGYLCVYHGILTNRTIGLPADYKQWSVVNNLLGPVQTGKWVRITILMKHEWEETTMSYFKVLINGIESTSPLAYTTTDILTSEFNGPWFLCAKYPDYGVSTFNKVTLSGSGMIDDFVVGTATPSHAPFVYVNTVGRGSVTPSGIVTIMTTPGSTNFNILASNYFYIANVYTGTVAGTSNAVDVTEGAESLNLDWANIASHSTLFVTFSPYLISNNVPIYWMADKGLSTNETYPTWNDVAAYDEDGDGMVTWAEFVAGTHPTNELSVLKIISQTFSNGAPRITWLSSAEAIAPYAIQLATNLTDAVWSNVAVNISADLNGTNNLTVDTPPSTPAFYRVTVTN